MAPLKNLVSTPAPTLWSKSICSSKGLEGTRLPFPLSAFLCLYAGAGSDPYSHPLLKIKFNDTLIPTVVRDSQLPVAQPNLIPGHTFNSTCQTVNQEVVSSKPENLSMSPPVQSLLRGGFISDETV
ncbi:hypothetical protein BDN72DRAFT_928480 [Pluteus cervinus]|uniref:Uncharacterized protein n=1 Tax=Pluteus cervinus TaxID=181527 RepID=A0ACD3ABV2_9AGAR|nr:hypothetical protein BDN72DRAFT_928480 [Pluteus cervinus]